MDTKCTATEAVSRAQMVVASKTGSYLLGTGDYNPLVGPGGLTDMPWSQGGYSDCAGFAICYCWKLHRHRPGFNKGSWATVEDDINVNSMLEDASHKKELAQSVVTTPEPGDLLCYPTFRLKGLTFVGHVAIVETVPNNFIQGRYDTLGIIQCHGPNGFRPGSVRTDGSLFLHHDSIWPLPQHRAHLVRMRTR